jgi:hypothetical protein
MGLDLSIIAKNPPVAFIVAGLVLILTGSASAQIYLVNIGTWCFIAGFILQILWLFFVKRGF